MTETRTVLTEDGRTLAYCTWGPRDGDPVFFLHGLPGSRLTRLAEDAYDRVGARVITFDRPGYGESTPAAGRTIGDGAQDVLAVADALGIEAFSIVGYSAGGPYALATAAAAPSRVLRCASVVGLAPRDADGLDWFAGMDEESVAEWRVAEEGEQALIDRAFPETVTWIAALAAAPDIPEPFRSELAGGFAEGLRPGPHGLTSDYLALLAPWRVDLRGITAETRVIAAREDTVDPPAHSEWLASRIPGAEFAMFEGGHMSPRADEDAALFAWLAG